MKIEENISLKDYHTFGVEVKTRYFAEYADKNELVNFLNSSIYQNNRSLHIGSGSNLLFIKDFNGLILHSGIRYIKTIEETNDFVILEAGSGVVWDDFVEYCVDNNLYGAENLSLIPGEVGASAVQNIGAYGSEAKDIIESVEAIELFSQKTVRVTNANCNYGYRKSVFKHDLKGKYIITSVRFKLSKIPIFNLTYQHLEDEVKNRGEISLKNVRKTIIDIRSSKLPDPKVTGNAGSFFMNPIVSKSFFHEIQKRYPEMPHYYVSETEEKIPAGWLIEKCGWKGKSLGNVGVHDKQALVIVNKGNATGTEIANLSKEIMTSVIDKFCIKLTPEVNFIE